MDEKGNPLAMRHCHVSAEGIEYCIWREGEVMQEMHTFLIKDTGFCKFLYWLVGQRMPNVSL